MDEQTRAKALRAMTDLVEASAAYATLAWESLSEEDRANLPPDLRAKFMALLSRIDEA